MERWSNKVAVVTGSSSGIGAATSKELVENGLIVVGLARRLERLEQLKSELPKNLQSKFYPIKCDVSNEDDVKKAFEWINKNLGGVDILISNAGTSQKSYTGLLGAENSKNIKNVLDTNVMGTVFCVREAFTSMKSRNVDGHVVVINSIVGHMVPVIPPQFGIASLGMYPPSKYAITAMAETYRQEFANAGTKIKITSISPGGVNTEMVPDDIKKSQSGKPILQPIDIAQAITYVLSTPPHVQVHELTIKPVGETM